MPTALNLLLDDLQTQRPDSVQVIETLLDLEKKAKREKITYPLAALLGTWQLTFITGTKKARQQAGSLLGKGRYVLNWVEISITYAATEGQLSQDWQRGTVTNRVKFGLLDLTVSGGIKYRSHKRLLAFDFNHVTAKLGRLKIYDGDMRGGKTAAEQFYETPIAKQAFFSYFYVSEKAIAARGRGGGLAIWTRINGEN